MIAKIERDGRNGRASSNTHRNVKIDDIIGRIEMIKLSFGEPFQVVYRRADGATKEFDDSSIRPQDVWIDLSGIITRHTLARDPVEDEYESSI